MKQKSIKKGYGIKVQGSRLEWIWEYNLVSYQNTFLGDTLSLF